MSRLKAAQAWMANAWAELCFLGTILSRLAYRVIEGGVVLGLFIVITYAGYWIFFGPITSPRYARVMSVLPVVNNNWKAILVLLIPLFYRTVRTFAEEIQEFGGAKRRAALPGPGEQTTNRPEGQS